MPSEKDENNSPKLAAFIAETASERLHSSSLTPEQKAARFIERCRLDERYFIEVCTSIVDREMNKVIPFKFNHTQNYYETIRSDFDMILKARKEGFTSRKIAGDLHACIFSKNEHAVLLSFDRPNTIMMMEERVKPFLKRCRFPFSYVPMRDHISFPTTKSRYDIGTAGTTRFGRGSDITRYHLTEAAFYESPNAITAVEEACLGTAKGSMETTANGQNFFHKMWRDAAQGKTRYKPIFIPWWLDAGYRIKGAKIKNEEYLEDEIKLKEAYKLDDEQLAWRRKAIGRMARPELFAQEFPASPEEAFISSGRMVFDWVALMNHERECKPPSWIGHLRDTGDRVEFFPQQAGKMLIWKQPVEGHHYIVGADVAEGLDNGAYSVAVVLDANTAEQVAEWHGHVPPDRFADVLLNIGYYFNTALLVPESWPGPGATTTIKLLDYRYRNLWQRPASNRHRTNPEQLYGWETDRRTRPQMIYALSSAIRDYKILINSRGIIDEMRGIIFDDDMDIKVHPGCFSDRVFACGIAWSVLLSVSDGVHNSRLRLKEMENGIQGNGAVHVPKWKGHRYGIRQ